MMESFKVLQVFTMPSFLLFAFFFLAGLFLGFKRNRAGKIILGSTLLLYYLLSLNLVADLFMVPLERPYEKSDFHEARSVHTAVLLTGGEKTNELRASALLRIFSEWRQFKISDPRIILSGTSPFKLHFDELGALRDYLVERGIPPSSILLDRKPLTTRQSSQSLKKVLGGEPFFLVTSAYHMTRSLAEFRYLGMKPIPAPADFTVTREYRLTSLLPSPWNLIKCDTALHEYEGIFFYRMIHVWHGIREKPAIYSQP